MPCQCEDNCVNVEHVDVDRKSLCTLPTVVWTFDYVFAMIEACMLYGARTILCYRETLEVYETFNQES